MLTKLNSKIKKPVEEVSADAAFIAKNKEFTLVLTMEDNQEETIKFLRAHTSYPTGLNLDGDQYTAFLVNEAMDMVVPEDSTIESLLTAGQTPVLTWKNSQFEDCTEEVLEQFGLVMAMKHTLRGVVVW